MGYVKRNADGEIDAWGALPNDILPEYIADDDPEVVAFLAPKPPVPSPNTLALLNHENRLRSQEGTPPLTLEDFRQQFKV